MNKVITSPATNIPAHEKSHVRGWSLGWAELLEADISNKCDDDIMQYDKAVSYTHLTLPTIYSV